MNLLFYIKYSQDGQANCIQEGRQATEEDFPEIRDQLQTPNRGQRHRAQRLRELPQAENKGRRQGRQPRIIRHRFQGLSEHHRPVDHSLLQALS